MHFSSLSPNAVFYYTTDGSDPSISSLSGDYMDLTSVNTLTVKAIAISPGQISSNITSTSVTVTKLATPTVSMVTDTSKINVFTFNFNTGSCTGTRSNSWWVDPAWSGSSNQSGTTTEDTFVYNTGRTSGLSTYGTMSATASVTGYVNSDEAYLKQYTTCTYTCDDDCCNCTDK